MEEILINNIFWIFCSLVIVLFIVYLIVKIHEWLMKIAITGILILIGMVFLLQYNNISVLNWDKIKIKAEDMLGIGKERFLFRKDVFKKDLGEKVKERMEDISKKVINKKNINELIKPLQRLNEKRKEVLNNDKKISQKDNLGYFQNPKTRGSTLIEF